MKTGTDPRLLCNDIKTNLGPLHGIDPALTIKAPCDQVDIIYFGEDTGNQCVAMSLSTLIYNKTKGLHSCPGIAVKRPGTNVGDGNQYCIQHCHNVQDGCI